MFNEFSAVSEYSHSNFLPRIQSYRSMDGLVLSYSELSEAVFTRNLFETVGIHCPIDIERSCVSRLSAYLSGRILTGSNLKLLGIDSGVDSILSRTTSGIPIWNSGFKV